jgi:GTP-binding protein Era
VSDSEKSVEGGEPGADFRCGRVAVVERPNVGSRRWSTLWSARASASPRKAQTTRHRVLGILTSADAQYVFVDTPGFQTQHASALNRPEQPCGPASAGSTS